MKLDAAVPYQRCTHDLAEREAYFEMTQIQAAFRVAEACLAHKRSCVTSNVVCSGLDEGVFASTEKEREESGETKAS